MLLSQDSVSGYCVAASDCKFLLDSILVAAEVKDTLKSEPNFGIYLAWTFFVSGIVASHGVSSKNVWLLSCLILLLSCSLRWLLRLTHFSWH